VLKDRPHPRGKVYAEDGDIKNLSLGKNMAVRVKSRIKLVKTEETRDMITLTNLGFETPTPLIPTSKKAC